MFKKKYEFAGAGLHNISTDSDEGNDVWYCKGKIIGQLGRHVVECHDEIDRLEALQPKENPRVRVDDEVWFVGLPKGIYKFWFDDFQGDIICAFDYDADYPLCNVTTLYACKKDAVSHVTHYQLLYEFPKEKKEYEIKGHYVVPTVIRVMATSEEEAKAYAKENNDKPWADVDVLSPTAKYYNGEYNEDPFAD